MPLYTITHLTSLIVVRTEYSPCFVCT